jgi:hypothetical protein
VLYGLRFLFGRGRLV